MGDQIIVDLARNHLLSGLRPEKHIRIEFSCTTKNYLKN